jgi:hypothetical protein
MGFCPHPARNRGLLDLAFAAEPDANCAGFGRKGQVFFFFLILRFYSVALPVNKTANPGSGDGSPGGDAKGAQPLGKNSPCKFSL